MITMASDATKAGSEQRRSADDDLLQRLEKAVNLSREKRYEEAVQVYNAITEEYANPPFELYDCRSATYDKMGKPQAALRDGQHMIRMERSDARGYLRTAQILLRMGKKDKAWDIYQSGLRNVTASSDGSKHQMLRRISAKLGRRLSPAAATDPLQVLPVELVHCVFGYLDFNERVSLLRVSKQWHQFIAGTPEFWRRMRFTKQKRVVRAAAMQKYFTYAARKMTHLELTATLPFSFFAPKLAQHCRNLQHLTFDAVQESADPLVRFVLGAPHLRGLIVGSATTLDPRDVWQILEKCPRLQRLEIAAVRRANDATRPLGHWITADQAHAAADHFPKLRRLQLGMAHVMRGGEDDLHLTQWLPSQTQLEDFALHGWRGSARQPLVIDLTTAARFLRVELFHCGHFRWKLPPTVEEVYFRECDTFALPEMPEGVPHLRVLHLQSPSVRFADEALVMHFANAAAPGTLHDLQQFGVDPHLLLHRGFIAGVQTLAIVATPCTDETLACLAQACPQLETLDVTGSTKVTGVGVKAMLFKEGAPLKELNVRMCENIGRDAIDLATSRGVRVRFGVPQPHSVAARGRRLRFD